MSRRITFVLVAVAFLAALLLSAERREALAVAQAESQAENSPPAPSGESETGTEELSWEQKIDQAFGRLVEWAAFLPFYNIAPWIGISDEPLTDENGTPIEGPTGDPVVDSQKGNMSGGSVGSLIGAHK